MTKRKFKGKSIDMLMASSILIENAVANKETLIEKRPLWADPYFSDLQSRIDRAFLEIVGISSVEVLKSATRNVLAIQTEAQQLLGDFKIQLDVAYTGKKNELQSLYSLLGFSSLYTQVQGRNQEALIQLLYMFKTNISDELKATFVSVGIPETLITQIVDLADAMKTANLTQEHSKGSMKELTQKGTDELNAIYTEVIGVAKIASRFFVGNNIKRALFSYSKVLSNLSRVAVKEEATDEVSE